ncbi:hypothetical protein ACFPZI_06040 [Streptomyces chlorus]|uniref:site-specific DNA-methyltransferase (adenine-specific) n=1 Tax=Streptomyces chlorus TaxID=887452 RepID=A0ABW1DTE0_9ACTN
MFVRFSEDNGLIADPWLSGPGERLAEAQDRHDAYFRANPSKNDRDWLLDSFDALAKSHRTVAGLFDRTHNPLYEVTPSYDACYRQYALSVPFAQRIFELGIRAGGDHRDGGFSGLITANSFMKRGFGKKLIEEFFPSVQLTHAIDTSGAFIPEHGTPTVILAGRNQMARQSDFVRAVLGVREEPSQPKNPENGLVWQAITTQVGTPGSEPEWGSVEDVERARLTDHPWSLSGGGAADLMLRLRPDSGRLGDRVIRIGFYGMTHADDAMLAPSGSFERHQLECEAHASLVAGEDVRDWHLDAPNEIFHPYDSSKKLLPIEKFPNFSRFLWPARTELGNRATFRAGNYFIDNRPWRE